MINHVVTVSSGQQRDSAIHKHVSILLQTPLLSRLPHKIKQSSCPYWLCILIIAMCTCQSQTPELSLPTHLSLQQRLFRKSVSLFLFYKLICIISF